MHNVEMTYSEAIAGQKQLPQLKLVFQSQSGLLKGIHQLVVLGEQGVEGDGAVPHREGGQTEPGAPEGVVEDDGDVRGDHCCHSQL